MPSPSPLSDDDRRLLEAARAARANAYAPYSGFLVGAAVRTADGGVYQGTNMENASYGLGLCAEAGALMAATAAGRLGEVLGIALVGGTADGAVLTPCGRCRQLIAEAASLGGRDIEAICANADASDVRRYRISELLPHAFGADSLAAPPDGVQKS